MRICKFEDQRSNRSKSLTKVYIYKYQVEICSVETLTLINYVCVKLFGERSKQFFPFHIYAHSVLHRKCSSKAFMKTSLTFLHQTLISYFQMKSGTKFICTFFCKLDTASSARYLLILYNFK